MKLKELYALPFAPAPDIKVEQYTEVTSKWGRVYERENFLYSVRKIEFYREELLEVTVFDYIGKPIFRTWQTDTRVLGQRTDRNDNIPTNSTINSMCHFYGHIYSTDEQSIETAKKWIEEKHKSMFMYNEGYICLQNLGNLQADIRHIKCDAEREKIRKSTDDKMLMIRNVPKNFEDRIIKDAYSNNHLLIYDYNRKAETTAYCTRCGNTVKVTKPRNYAECVCPHCKRAMTYISKYTLCRHKEKTYTKDVQLCQKFKQGGFVVRYFHSMLTIDYKWKITLKLEECFRCFHEKISEPVYISSEYEFINKYNNGYNWHRCFSRYGISYISGYVYPDNLKKLFNDTEYKYIPLANICNNCKNINIERTLQAIQKDKSIEHLSKHKLWNLTKSRINAIYTGWNTIESEPCNYQTLSLNAKNIKESLCNLTMPEIRYFININVRADQLLIYRILKSVNQNTHGNMELSEKYEMYRRSVELQKVIKYVKFKKLIEYLIKQVDVMPLKDIYTSNGENKKRKEYVYEVLQTYKDYLKDCERLGYNLKNDFILYPNNLYNAHQSTIAAIKTEKSKILDKEIKEISQKYKKLEYKSRDFIIKVATSSAELINEGQTLHHCVGRYAEDMAEENSIIFFVRQANKSDTPFVTLELNPHTNDIVQVRTKHNQLPPIEVTKFVEKWKLKKLHKAEKRKGA